MPQLIAMIIVVVGAMIYMFQTFGGTGDKIEGIAQKTSVITEINNIKNGLKLAARSGDIKVGTTLEELATLKYFPEQINDQINKNTEKSEYYAISFGGQAPATKGGMIIKLVAVTEGKIPGILVSFKDTTLADSGAFLESQIANDLKAVARLDRTAKIDTPKGTGTYAKLTGEEESAIHTRLPEITQAETTADGEFVVYFNDFGANEVVVKAD